ncbi:MAG: pilus assembly protein PilM [Ectothiorhodospiraceae bacterium]
MALFQKKTPPLLGIDISSTAVKLVELRAQHGQYRVESYAVQPLAANAVSEKSIADIDAVSEAIKSAVRQSRTRLRTAALAVPGSAVISKTLSMPADLSEQELEAQVELQADQYVPYPLDEVHRDFQVVGSSQGSNSVDVLLVASRSDNVESRVDACEAAGVTPKVMDVESYATETAFGLVADELPGGARDQAVAVVDIGATMTTLTVLDNREIIYTREQVFGGVQLSEEIQRRCGLSYEEEVLEPFRQAMAQQVARSLQFFYGASQHNTVDAIVLAGGCANIPGICDIIQEEAGVATQIANPFARMAVSSRIKPEHLSADAPALLIACGLAMRSFDS